MRFRKLVTLLAFSILLISWIEINRNEAIDLERPKPTLYYALHSLQMALQLLNASPSPDSTSVDQITDPREIALLRVGILSTGAYVTLTLGCYDDTVKLSNELLGIVGLPNIFQYVMKCSTNCILCKIRVLYLDISGDYICVRLCSNKERAEIALNSSLKCFYHSMRVGVPVQPLPVTHINLRQVDTMESL